MNKNDVKNALECLNVSTARGRRTLARRQIEWSANKEDCAIDASIRTDGYLDVAKHLRLIVTQSHDGISDDELESVEFIMEQLEELSRKAHETAIKNY